MIDNKNAYIYDVEIFPNFFGVTFIPEYTSQNLIDAYINIDKLILKHKHFNTLETNKKEVDKLKKDKEKLLKVIGIKQFVIWKDTKSNKFRNDLALLIDFYRSHKIQTGYNSFNYDRIMIDIIIYNNRYVGADGWFTKENKHITEYMFYHSHSCIDYGIGYYRLLDFKKYYKRPFTDYDIQKILYLDKTLTSLKQVAICLKWYRIQDLPLPFDKPVMFEQIYDINDYNVNDVLITLVLKRNQSKEIELREDISNEFGIDVRNLSRSSIGKAITTSLYEKFSGISKSDFINTKTDRWKIKVRDIVSDKIVFKTPVLQNLLRIIKNQTIVVGSEVASDKFQHIIKFADKIYTMALGGLHSQDDPRIYDYTDIYIYRDADVASYYPRGILNFDVYPQHLIREAFRAVVGYTADTRVDAKHQAGKIKKVLKSIQSQINSSDGKVDKDNVDKLKKDFETLNNTASKLTIKSEGLKIAINRMYGAFRDINDYLYDPKCTYQTTINLQLCLLMLIEDLEIAKIEVISANTDGIVCRFKPEQEDEYKRICQEWQDLLNFELEFTDYEKYFRSDVNNYIAIKKGFKNELEKIDISDKELLNELEETYIKRKGSFIEEIAFNKGYNSPVVSKAINQFFLYDVPYTYFIENYVNTYKDAIYEYCISQKSNRKYSMIFTTLKNGKIIENTLQKSNRFYISKSGYGGVITKREKDSKKELRIVAGYYSTVFNDYLEEDDYHINFDYYKRECSKVIYGKKKTKRGNNRKNNGILSEGKTLFDGMFEKEDLFAEVKNPVEEIVDTKIKKSNVDSIPNDFKVNNTYWGMMGFATKEEYDEQFKTEEDYQKQQLKLDDDMSYTHSDSYDFGTDDELDDLPF